MTLAPTLGPMVRQLGASLVEVADRLAKAGFAAAQLDATLPGVRPRELSPLARRDLAGSMTRRGVQLAGIDLFIPRKDFLDDQKMDRAMAAALAGIELAGDLGRIPLSLPLPVKQMDSSARGTLVEAADGRGVTLAIHAEDQLDALSEWIKAVDRPALGMAIDPAAVLARQADADELIHRHSAQLVVARLSDFSITAGGSAQDDAATGLRCIVGQGELSVPSYRIALDLAKARRGPVVLDLRNMENVLAAAVAGKKAWEDAAFGG